MRRVQGQGAEVEGDVIGIDRARSGQGEREQSIESGADRQARQQSLALVVARGLLLLALKGTRELREEAMRLHVAVAVGGGHLVRRREVTAL